MIEVPIYLGDVVGAVVIAAVLWWWFKRGPGSSHRGLWRR